MESGPGPYWGLKNAIFAKIAKFCNFWGFCDRLDVTKMTPKNFLSEGFRPFWRSNLAQKWAKNGAFSHLGAHFLTKKWSTWLIFGGP